MRAIVVHGGAGAAPTASDRAASACENALAFGWNVLAAGGSAVDAVVRAVAFMEDVPFLNAGVGACLTEDGTVELDAAVMDGNGRRAGGVALVKRLAHPILAAHALMNEGRHVLLAGDAAEAFAASQGLTLVEPETLVTPERRAAWDAQRGDAGGRQGGSSNSGDLGTVGAVALDGHGHVAAATSTGGISGKRAGRIGDSPIVGAGILADDRAGAASATGNGEAIIRATVTATAMQVLRTGAGPERAVAAALGELADVGGTGGIIVVDRFGRVAAAHTTPHMAWASRRG